MAKVRVRTTGAALYRKKLKTIPLSQHKHMHLALKKNADEFAAAVRAQVPVDDADLKKSIKVSFKDPLKVVITEGNSKIFYASFQEFGRKASPAKDGRPAHPGIAKKPHFFTTYRSMKKRLRRRVLRAINKSAKESAKRR